MILVDSNIIIDTFEPGSDWFEWSTRVLGDLADDGLFIDSVVAAEIGSRFHTLSEFIEALEMLGLPVMNLPLQGSWLAGQAYLAWVRNGGRRGAILPDLLIGAHATAEGARVLTRDPRRFRTYFPELELITPETHND